MNWMKISILFGTMIFSMAACKGDDVNVFDIDGHIFQVPDEYLIKIDTPLLKNKKTNGLVFFINQNGENKEKIIVSIESYNIICHPKSPPLLSQLTDACLAALRSEKENKYQEAKFERFYRNESNFQWEYRIKDNNTNVKTIASCYGQIGNEEMGRCTSIHNYKNLVYSFTFSDKNINELYIIYNKIYKLLTSWEKKS